MTYRASTKDHEAMVRRSIAQRVLYDEGPLTLREIRDINDCVAASTLATMRKEGYVEQVWDEAGDRKVWQLTARGKTSESSERSRRADRERTRAISNERARVEREERERAADQKVADRVANWLLSGHLISSHLYDRIINGEWNARSQVHHDGD